MAEAEKWKKGVDDVRLAAAQYWHENAMTRAAPPPPSGVGLLTGLVPRPSHRRAPALQTGNEAPRKIMALEVLATRLLDGVLLQALNGIPVTLPVRPHALRVPSAERGVSLSFVRAPSAASSRSTAA